MTQNVSTPLHRAGPPISDREFALFRDYVATSCGIALEVEKKYLLESRLAPLLSESSSTTYGEFYAKARADTERWRDRIIECMTTNETLWFRDSHPWRLLRDALLPKLAARAQAEKRTVRIWSAGCSTGQEPYSIAMLLDSLLRSGALPGLGIDDFEIVGSDISRAAIHLARAGRYDRVSMRRGLIGEWKSYGARYFRKVGTVHTLRSDMLERVQLEKRDLQEDFARLGQFDLILLRYVAIYFSVAFRRTLFDRIAHALKPHGSLLLGSAEVPSDMPESLKAMRYGSTFTYRLRGQ